MKVSFLFGSGADTDACEKLESGQAFAEALLRNSYKDEIEAITGINASRFQLLYPQSKKIYMQTIMEYEEKAIPIFGEELIKQIKKSYTDGYKELTEVEKKTIDAKCKDFYARIMCDNDSEEKDFFLNNAVFFDSLDEKFNSLRNTDLNSNSNARRVINAYYTVFLTVFYWLYGEEAIKACNSILKVTAKLRENYILTTDENCYYSKLGKSKLDCNVITTNYTELAGLSNKGEIAYLHGKMTWFEDLEKLTVYDCTDEDELKCLQENDKIYVPFIMIPSGVKPIICTKQIREFEKFINYLDESEYLVIVGYKFNSEDNHINSIIADWLRKSNKNKIVYLNYDDAVDFKKFKWLKENSVNDIEFSKNKTNIDSACSIINISIRKDNCRIVFNKILQELEEKTHCNGI